MKKFANLFFSTVLFVPLCPQAVKADESALLKDAKAQLKELQERMAKLESQKRLTDKEAPSTGSNASLKLYGHLNRAAVWKSNGVQSHMDYMDNDAHSSRFALLATAKSNAKQTVGGLVEINVIQNSTATSDIRNSASDPANLTIRKSEVFLKDETYGDFFIGRGAMVSDGSIEDTDFSGISHVFLGANGQEIASGVSLINKRTGNRLNTGGGTTATVRVKDIIGSTDGLSRRDRVRYNSPAFYGVSLQASHGYTRNNDVWDVAAKWGATMFDHKFAAIITYAQDNTVALTGASAGVNTGYKQVDGSAGVLFKNGFNVFIGGAHRNWDFAKAQDGRMLFTKLGYQWKQFEAGLTSLAVDFGDFRNLMIDATSDASIRFKYKGQAKGIAINQSFDRIATDVYAAYRHFNWKVGGGASIKFKNVQAVMVGARIKF